jgi:methylenetetrahydrofolate dehydrogenase (NADP+) / methenyltetrahydrofolate cyclohydrolase
MVAERIDGKALAAQIRTELKEVVSQGTATGNRPPGLGVILVGEDPASAIYVRNKKKACEEVGIRSFSFDPPPDINQEALEAKVDEWNKSGDVDGILMQLPLPDHLDSQKILDMLEPAKDVDGFHPMNQGKLMTGLSGHVACTPLGVMEMIDRNGIELKGKNAVIVGRSNIVGKPMAFLLLARHCTVTICHSRTQDLPGVCRGADILVAAVGRPEMIKGDWIKPGAVVLDVGINRIERDGKFKLVGDVAFDEAAEKASLITPVPGGVGPMTIAMLLSNTVKSWKEREGIS